LIYDICKVFVHLIGVFTNLLLTMLGTVDSKFYEAQFMALWQELLQSYNTLAGGFSEMLVDAIFFYGIRGKWLKNAFSDVCDKTNDLWSYIHTEYCQFVVKIGPYFLAVFSNVMTYIDTGFTIVNKFILMIVNEYLPEMALGLVSSGVSAFYASQMVAEKRQAYDRAFEKVTAVELQLNARAQQEALTANKKNEFDSTVSDKNTLNNLGGDDLAKKTTKKTVLTVMEGLKYADFIAQAYQIYSDINTMIKIKEALEKLPNLYTIFDFTTIQNAITNIGNFLNEDVFCYGYTESDLFDCDFDEVSQELVKQASGIVPYASQCWTDIQVQDYGATTIFSCIPTSICCVDDICSEKVICIECPPAPDRLTTQYGCNIMTHMCQCNVQKKFITHCVTHKDCYQSNTVCSLAVDLNEKAYGNIECQDCKSQAICLITSSSKIGQCTCLAAMKDTISYCRKEYTQRPNTILPQSHLLCGYSSTSTTILSQYFCVVQQHRVRHVRRHFIRQFQCGVYGTE
jgi:hypothetical protein